ncbi:MAG: helix-turn-helix domain-containing protein [Candidatus Moranbacteria bacterium]|nr:helix-turn-helix domain-containing protein [Candidatus Moranbacteria bacterium]
MNGFIRKRVQSSTLGEKLKKSRLDRRISLNEASRNTKIQVRYLEHLEGDEYSKLPADVYTKGFLRNYAQYLGLDPDRVVTLFDKEKGIQKNIRKDADEDTEKKKVKVSRFIVTPRIMGTFIVSLIIFTAFFYLYNEFDNFVSTPRLVIKHPLSSHETINDSHVHFEGVTDEDNEVTINGGKVTINDKGFFSSDISLQKGVNNIVIVAINRFGKESKKEFFINSNVADDEEDILSYDEKKKESFDVEIVANRYLINVVIKEGEREVYRGVVHPGFPQKISVAGDFSISSDNGMNTIVSVNGEKKGALGDLPEPVDSKVFEVKVDENSR